MNLFAAPLLIAVLAASGWLVSFYFLMVYRQKLSHKTRWLPRYIQISGPACTNIVDSPFGRVFRKPNAFWGLWYFGSLIPLAAAAAVSGTWVLQLLIAVTGGALLFSFYLLYGLYKLRIVCRPCLTIHTINSIIFILALASSINF